MGKKEFKIQKKTHALESKRTFWAPREVNISSEPPPKNPDLLRRTMPSASVTLPPLFFEFGSEERLSSFSFFEEVVEREKKNEK